LLVKVQKQLILYTFLKINFSMKKVLLLIFTLSTFFAQAQDSNFGNWINYFGNKKINSKWNLHHEAQYRNYNAVGDLEQLLLRTGIGYNLSENNNNLLLGYGYINSQNYTGSSSDDKIQIEEHRIYQQFITKQSFGRVNISHRYRFEQRFVEADFKVRFRYFLAFQYLLNNSDFTDDTFYLTGYNEIFINTKTNIFDRNRLYGGLGYKLNKLARFELGYMNQFFAVGGRDQLNMNVFLSF